MSLTQFPGGIANQIHHSCDFYVEQICSGHTCFLQITTILSFDNLNICLRIWFQDTIIDVVDNTLLPPLSIRGTAVRFGALHQASCSSPLYTNP